MPSTYSNNGFELIAPGEQENTWGDTTNENWELVDEAIDGIVEITSSSTTQSLTTSDGISSNGRHKVIRYTGTPGGTITVTVSGNDVQKIYFISNETTDDSDITFTQGSGGDVTVSGGQTAILYCDGAGAGAKVTDFSGAVQQELVQITGGTLSNVTITNSTITNDVTGDLTGDVTGNVTGDLTGNADTASALETARTITLNGDVSGSQSFDGSANVTITVTIADDSHNHLISNIDGLQGQLDLKAPLASPAFTGNPTASTQLSTDDSTRLATTAFVQNVAQASASGFTMFNNASGEHRSQNLSVSKLGTGRYRITLSSSIRNGTSNYAVVSSGVDDGSTNGATFSSTGIDVYGLYFHNFNTSYFDVDTIRKYNTGLAFNGRGNDGNDSQRFAQVLTNFPGRLGVAVYTK